MIKISDMARGGSELFSGARSCIGSIFVMNWLIRMSLVVDFIVDIHKQIESNCTIGCSIGASRKKHYAIARGYNFLKNRR